MKLLQSTQRYVSVRRSLGEKCVGIACALRRFARSVGESREVGSVTSDECRSFLYQGRPEVGNGWFSRHSAINGYFNWLVSRGDISRSPVPAETPRRPAGIRPYIYSDAELKALISSAARDRGPRRLIRPKCAELAMILTSTLGLRISETFRIRLLDIDADERTIRICGTKFYKSRIVTVNPTVAGRLADYLAWRKRRGMPNDGDAPLLVNSRGKPIGTAGFRRLFAAIRRDAGIERHDGAIYQPRLHDLRHTFAVRTLTSWYRDGRDVQTLLPNLATFLGHGGVRGTCTYLTMTPELLDRTCRQFELYAEKEGIVHA